MTATPFDELFELETVVAHAVDEEHDVCAVVISIVFTSELVVFFGVNVFAVDLAHKMNVGLEYKLIPFKGNYWKVKNMSK